MNKESKKMYEKICTFLTIYMPKQRGLSQHTITSYRQTINQFLLFVKETRKIRYEEICFQDWSASMINKYLVYLEQDRIASASTRNQRLFAIRSFLKYARLSNPELMSLSMEAGGIAVAKEAKEPVAFLSEQAMEVLLRQPDDTKKIGLRDMCFMITMYDTAARDCEMLNLKVSSLDLNSNCPKIRLDGKGNKVRYVPLMKKTVQHLKRYLSIYHAGDTGDDWLFYTVSHGRRNQMSDDNVARFLAKYSGLAKSECDEVPGKVTPHQFRHSRAMHLYRNGMSLQLLAEYMGHASVVSTQIYAYADTEMKRAALEKCQRKAENITNELPEWQVDEEMIKKLYGLA
ncbi:MAG: site-specific integrase [Lachnospiraceae bacterium]|nr:site-specific integrase [Lachnospiraceae bacterium]